MSRLYDDIRSQNLHQEFKSALPGIVGAFNMPEMIKGESFADFFNQATVVVADNVSEYYYAENDKEVWWPHDFPNAAPPFPVFFIESKRASRIVSATHGVQEWDDQRPLRWGALFIGAKLKKESIKPGLLAALDDIQPKFQPKPDNDAFKKGLLSSLESASSTGGWLINSVLFFEMADGSVMPVWESMFVVDSDGAFVLPEDGKSWSFLSTPHGWVKNLVEMIMSDPKAAESLIGLDPRIKTASAALSGSYDLPQLINETVIANEIAGYLKPLWLAVSFMHCKNVDRIEHRPDVQLQRARHKRGKAPLSRHYTLQIDPTRTPGMRTHGAASNSLSEQPERIVRGHFATYGMVHPEDGRMRGKLFGKYSGRFWVPKHELGNREHGEITKDYEVKA